MCARGVAMAAGTSPSKDAAAVMTQTDLSFDNPAAKTRAVADNLLRRRSMLPENPGCYLRAGIIIVCNESHIRDPPGAIIVSLKSNCLKGLYDIV